MFCVFQGQKSPVLHGTDFYLEHVRNEHCGQLLGEVVLHRANCITGRIADDAEDFDINLWPLVNDDLADGKQSQLPSDKSPDVQLDGSRQAETSSDGNDFMFQASSPEPWNRGLSEFHWGGDLGTTELM
nr:hypothetical protein CFP56_69576 [Quercus suber]